MTSNGHDVLWNQVESRQGLVNVPSTMAGSVFGMLSSAPTWNIFRNNSLQNTVHTPYQSLPCQSKCSNTKRESKHPHLSVQDANSPWQQSMLKNYIIYIYSSCHRSHILNPSIPGPSCLGVLARLPYTPFVGDLHPSRASLGAEHRAEQLLIVPGLFHLLPQR